ncbi:RNA splicing factor PRP9 [Gloeopeniophorella convolvens]|nr:RNA splicing factor PRP9 [Gloeopeniophorella convolvens]
MDSVIEIQRQTHEEIERYERALYIILSRPANVHQTRLQNEHKSAQILDRISSRITTLNTLYRDQDARKTELDAISAPSQPGDLSEFYARLGKIQEHHNKYPDAGADGFELEVASFLEEFNPEDYDEEIEYEDPVANMFSGEEVYGKYLDLYSNHTVYNNLKNVGKRIGYLQYLDLLMLAEKGPVHAELSKDTRFSRDYELYIGALNSYLTSFMRRTQPLVDIDSKQVADVEEFGKLWEAGEVEDWTEAPRAQPSENGEGIWCTACQKMYSKQTVYDAHLTSKKHIKATSKQASTDQPPANPNGPPSSATPSASTASNKDKHRTVALLTHLVTALLKDLIPVLADTKSNVERRFSLTAKEREQEILEAQKPPAPPPVTAPGEGGAEEEEEEERIYNPLKLPMGWDGKPIPYWLYKLHGLGVEYRCEICSDHVYMGRKNFERHFQESRHAFGMRALGLPNTKHFHEITKIEDAMALAERLKREGRHEIFEQETMEELEDEEGNVYNRKTYDDLKKQGLI